MQVGPRQPHENVHRTSGERNEFPDKEVEMAETYCFEGERAEVLTKRSELTSARARKLRRQRTRTEINLEMLLILGGRSVREDSADCRGESGKLDSQAQQTPDVAFPNSALSALLSY